MSEDDEDDVCAIDTTHIQFYANVNRKNVATLNRLLHVMSRKLDRRDVITVFIQSNGGEVGYAFSAVDHMRTCRVPVHTVIDGEVCSAASIIATGGARRFVMPNGTLLVHQLRTSAEGTASTIVDAARHCKKVMRSMKKHYLRYCRHLDASTLDKMLRHDTLLNATECLRYGMADAVYDP